MTEGVGYDKISDLYLLKLYKECLAIATEFKWSLPEEKAWWILRWSYFGDETTNDEDDAKARISFVKKFGNRPDFQGFISYNDAEEIVSKRKKKVAAFFDDTIPGNICLLMFSSSKKNYVQLLNINKHFNQDRTLLEMARDVFSNSGKFQMLERV